MPLKDRLVDDWCHAWSWWSSRLAVVAGVVATFIVAAPETALGVLNALPPETRAAISPAVGMIVFGAAMFTRLWKQRLKGEAPPAPTSDAG